MPADFAQLALDKMGIIMVEIAKMQTVMAQLQKESEKNADAALAATQAAAGAAEAAAKAADVAVTTAQTAAEVAKSAAAASAATTTATDVIMSERADHTKTVAENTKEIAKWQTTTKVIGAVISAAVVAITLWLKSK